ncbi:MAG: hypothetical protein JW900_14920 [Anaerolineae bacterium]|nr:hypothetical protein [Anaerolineae bacterium]
MSRKSLWIVLGLALAVLALASCTPVEPEMSYQGQLTDPSGNPVSDGNYQMTFRLYDIDNNLEWEETQTVAVNDGLFNATIGAVNYITPTIFSQQLWLGVEVNGDGEMTPRQKLTGAPFAMTLVPGAVIVGGSNIDADEPGLLNFGDSGTGYTIAINTWAEVGLAIDGASVARQGVVVENVTEHAASLSSQNGTAVIASRNAAPDIGADDDAYHGVSYGEGAYLYSRGTNVSDYGVLARGTDGYGLYAWSANAAYSAYFAGPIFVETMCVGCTYSSIGRNVSSRTLQPGDAVHTVGAAMLTGMEVPIIEVAPAAAGETVFGVVAGRTELTMVDEENADGARPGPHFYDVGGAAGPNQYLVIVVQGPAQVRADAAAEIAAGDLLYLGADGVTTEASGQPLGMALDIVDADGLVWVMVGFH